MAEKRVTIDELAEAAFGGVLRALDARKVGAAGRGKLLPGPILVGIIWWPEREVGELPMGPAGEFKPSRGVR